MKKWIQKIIMSGTLISSVAHYFMLTPQVAIAREIEGKSPLYSSSTKCQSILSAVSKEKEFISLTLEEAIKIAQCNNKELEEAILSGVNVKSITNQIRFETTKAYYKLQEQDAWVAIRSAAIEDASQILREAEQLERAGLGTRFDVLHSKIRLAEANKELTLTISNQRTARSNLAKILNLNIKPTAQDAIEESGVWGFSLEETISLATKNLDNDEFLSSSTPKEIQFQVEKAYYKLVANKENISVTEDIIIIATEALKRARLRFQAGVGTQTDVIISGQNLTIARASFLSAIISYNQAFNSLQWLLGYP